jgi:preprotein translocase subunit YajC
VQDTIWTTWTTLFAEGQAGGGGGGSLFAMMWPLIAIFFLFWFLLMRPQQQERKRHQAMLAALRKNDRVITVGGIYGVVTNVHKEADEVTIKVDEAANVKLRVTLGSIARVMREESSDDASSK